jgi:hypothetical protein
MNTRKDGIERKEKTKQNKEGREGKESEAERTEGNDKNKVEECKSVAMRTLDFIPMCISGG